MKIIYCIGACMLFLSCHKDKKEYIEITSGLSMDPGEPRIGVLINDKDSVYICKEIIKNHERTGEYIYFNSLNKISFDTYKDETLKVFNSSISFHSIPDAQPQQLVYFLNGKQYKQRFYFHQLSAQQKKAVTDILHLNNVKDLRGLPDYNKFSKELLEEVNPIPPIK
ncbi:hypothetical protein [Chryseobacterium sediminis]|uniref:hypothetical protein n=1 Tax=Chryseobacterium sediminis TaxID=1679494 RepID=UPI002858A361|nr:hypothetical protein [Chryseobacterium sediminis]MDR6464583.1 hypothetical protein [Chryseobacterium sediminis]